MSAPNLPNALLKFGLALAKHYVKKVIGDEALQEIATTAADISGEEVKAKVDSILGNKEGEKQLLKAAKAADKNFVKKCKDKDFRELFTMEHGDLPSVQTAIANLPKELDDEALRETLFKVFRSELPKRVSDEQVEDGVELYVKCLKDTLLPVKDFGLHVLYSELKEIGKDVKDVKAGVDFLVENAKNASQGTTDSKNYARFLVPFPHNPDFVGRETELSSLHEMLQQGQSIVGIRPTVLVGLGGIGKTQLAVEYAHAYRDDYPNGVFWLNAINPLLFEFSDLAEKLEMADRDTPRDKAARRAWDYLDSHPDALVIFDNVLEPSELNVPFSPDLVPANLRCRTLFTTRQRDFPRTFQPFEVKVLPEMAAMKLLLRSRPEVLEEHHPEWGWARIVCAYLGWLPLALELAAAYLGMYPEVSITDYLERLRTEGSLETVDESEVRAVDLPTRVEEMLKAAAAGNLEIKHQVAVSATLQTQWKRLDDEDAKLLFRAAGQFPEASWIPIPRLGLLTGIESEAKTGRPSPLNVALKKLHAVSLIEELSDDRLRLHPLVQEFATRLSTAPASFRLEMAERIAVEFNDLLRFQARVIHYGIDMALEDIRTALSFCIGKPETETYSHISKMEHVIDGLAYCLRNWNAMEEPVFFLQQIRQVRNEAYAQELEQWRTQAEAELVKLKEPYLFERFPIPTDPAELRSLVGHNSNVYGVALSADGRLAVSASRDCTLKVWDVKTGRELRTLTGHSDSVVGVALSAYGQLIVSASSDHTLKVWDVSVGRELRTLIGHSDEVYGVALSVDGRLSVSASLDKTLKVWDIETGRELRTLIGHSSFVHGVALSADGKLAVSASSDHTLKVWDVKTGRELRTLVGHSDEVNGVALSANGRLAVSASSDHTLKVWDVGTGRELRTFIGHSYSVKSAVLSADGKFAISASEDQTLKVWDVKTGRELRSLTGHSGEVSGVALSANNQLAISSGNMDLALKVWDISIPLAVSEISSCNTEIIAEHKHRTVTAHTNSVISIALSADGRLAVSASRDNTLKVWDASIGHELRTLVGHNSDVHGVALSADGRLAVSASWDDTLKVWDIETGRELHTLIGHSSFVHGVALSANARIAISASMDKTLKVWDVKTGRKLRTLAENSVEVRDVALSADGRVALSASGNDLIVWDIKTGSKLHTLKKLSDSVNKVVLSANGRLAVPVCHGNDELLVLDVSTGREICTLTGHSSGVDDAVLSIDNRLVVSASWDKTIKVWDILTKSCTATLLIGVSLECCTISADGKTIAAGDALGGVHFLELIGADELLPKDVKIKKSWLALKKEREQGS